ncbi:prolipoprotein diacylglyceryl transferase [Lutibacter sp. A80]|uniref:prolipoprotein diacylglyceryl transferase n=1 Tax=Lutibacter sp. A80 TaxID=2918453 RepID=UPI001F0635F5|nr:prolipoprotein diacylglyceryl transferase [Lutibacter sp. A80]UMB60360.1 prolipoprotein diacylglyceryl transferase [Lutibacter sp. A80]
MYPQLFTFHLPEFLSNFLNIQEVTIYTYAFCIASGTLVAALYTKWRAKKEMNIANLPNSFFYLIFIAGFIGGKLFYYLEKPLYFLNNPHLMLNNFSGGFVFYGSFVTIIPFVIWYLKKHKISILPMLDILAITTLIVHSIGRIGCFNAGCCYGAPTNNSFGMVFPTTHNTTVHPTQLYEAITLIILIIILLIIKKRQQFSGQIFLFYLVFYAISRAILELFRGDNRGYIFENILSHSQFIALLILITASVLYIKLKTKNKINLNN